MLEPEREEGDRHAGHLVISEEIAQQHPQGARRVLGGIDDLVCVLLQVRQQRAFHLHARKNPAGLREQGVFPARLLEAVHERGVGGFQEEELRVQTALLQFLQCGRQGRELLPGAGVHNARHAIQLPRAVSQLREVGDQRRRDVVDAVIAEVLEGAQRQRFPRARYARYDDETHRFGVRRSAFGVGSGPVPSEGPTPNTERRPTALLRERAGCWPGR